MPEDKTVYKTRDVPLGDDLDSLSRDEAIEEIRRLRQQNHVLEAMIDDAPANIWIKDADARIIYCNHAYERNTELPRSELLGSSAYDRYNEEQKEVARAADRRVLEEKKPIELVETIDRHGQPRHLLTLKTPIEVDGETCIAGISIDQTANIVAQQNLHQDILRNEHTINIRDRLLMILGHDVRSPIASLIGYCDQVEGSEIPVRPEDISFIFKSISHQSKSLLAMIDNMLAWVRSQQQSLNPSIRAVTIHELICRSRDLYGRFIGEKSISVNVPNLGPATVFADPDMLDIILRNLLSNAIKFTPKGGTIDIERAELDEAHLAITVSDSGYGIDPEKAKELSMSQTLEHTEGTDSESGLGLGLSLCKDLVERMDGELRFEPLNPGTRATVVLPRVDLNKDLVRLIYRSEAVGDFSAEELEKLAECASVSNQRLGITGLLLYRKGTFIQLLEGQHSVVQGLYRRIVRDRRHHNLLLLQQEAICEKIFPDWQMRLFMGEERVDFRDFLSVYESAQGSDELSIDMVDALFRSSGLNT